MKNFWIEFDIGVFARISYHSETNGDKILYYCHAYLVPQKDIDPTEDDFAFSFSFSRPIIGWEPISPVGIDSAYKQLVDLSEELSLDMVTAIRDHENNQPAHLY
jgi:hypothetical protein